MRRFVTLLGLALLAYALVPGAAQAQIIYVQPRPYVVVSPSYYYAPSVTTYSAPATYSYYPPTTTVYSAPPTTVYSAPIVTYAAPVGTYLAPASGVITTRSYYGYGIFRPRGYYTESYYTPLR